MNSVCRIAASGLIASSLFVVSCSQRRSAATLGTADMPTADSTTILRAALGRQLFFDKGLSSTGEMSCATCHDPQRAFTENRPKAQGIGVNARRRNTMSVINVGLKERFGWDGRFESLEAQVDEAFTVDGDMGVTVEHVIDHLRSNARYRQQFLNAYGHEPDKFAFTNAIATYQRFLLSGASRFDRYLLAGDSSAITADEKAGWKLFSRRLNCAGCHSIFSEVASSAGVPIVLFSDHRFHNLGVGFADGRMLDSGRSAARKLAATLGQFATPSLRNVAKTSPYMHDGSLASLEEVIRFYERGGNRNPDLDVVMIPFQLNGQERQQLIAFLGALTSEDSPDERLLKLFRAYTIRQKR